MIAPETKIILVAVRPEPREMVVGDIYYYKHGLVWIGETDTFKSYSVADVWAVAQKDERIRELETELALERRARIENRSPVALAIELAPS